MRISALILEIIKNDTLFLGFNCSLGVGGGGGGVISKQKGPFFDSYGSDQLQNIKIINQNHVLLLAAKVLLLRFNTD